MLVVRKPIKNLHLSVLPPDGRIRVSSPFAMRDDAIRALIATRLPWIHKQQKSFNEQERQTPREFVDGESHYFLGRRYRLRLKEDAERTSVTIRHNRVIEIATQGHVRQSRRADILMDWYRSQLRQVLAELVQDKSKMMGLKPSKWGIKRMKTRWGTCNHRTRQIWFNLELAKRPPHCVEYVVVHELAHLKEKTHNKRFTDLLDRFCPQWQSAKNDLNRLILAHDEWES